MRLALVLLGRATMRAALPRLIDRRGCGTVERARVTTAATGPTTRHALARERLLAHMHEEDANRDRDREQECEHTHVARAAHGASMARLRLGRRLQHMRRRCVVGRGSAPAASSKR